jgi:glycosyltransferase involved in cell wall biosynthesis
VLRVLFILPDLAYSSAGKQLTLLAKNLPANQFQGRLCVISRTGPLLRNFHEAGIEPDFLNWHRAIDAKPFVTLRKVVQELDPQIIHTWGKSAWKFACSALRFSSRTLIVSSPEINRGRKVSIPLIDRLLLRRASYVVASSNSESEFHIGQRCNPALVMAIKPAVAADPPPPSAGVIPPPGRVILCVGPIRMEKGYRDAVWAFDLLKCLYQDLHLIIAGDGPNKSRLEHFVRNDPKRSDVHFMSDKPDIMPFFSRADVVWVPSRVERGMNVALEAMAASKPVVASRLPAFAEIIDDRETGILFQPGDRVALARQTRLLLDNAEERRRIGDAGRKRVACNFSIESLVSAYADLYRRAAKNS